MLPLHSETLQNSTGTSEETLLWKKPQDFFHELLGLLRVHPVPGTRDIHKLCVGQPGLPDWGVVGDGDVLRIGTAHEERGPGVGKAVVLREACCK